MRYRKIPSSGEALPVIGLRDDALTGDTTEAVAELEGALRLVAGWGGLIDSHPNRSIRQETIGQLLANAGLKAGAFVATKVCARGRHAGLRQIQSSLRRLDREHADLILIDNLTDWSTQYQTLRALKEEGIVRYIGLSDDGWMLNDELEAALRCERFDLMQLRYSIDERDVERRLLPLALDHGIGVLASHPPLPKHSAAAPGSTDRNRASIEFVLQHPAVIGVLLDARDVVNAAAALT